MTYVYCIYRAATATPPCVMLFKLYKDAYNAKRKRERFFKRTYPDQNIRFSITKVALR
jgi:hypothetical protein